MDERARRDVRWGLTLACSSRTCLRDMVEVREAFSAEQMLDDSVVADLGCSAATIAEGREGRDHCLALKAAAQSC